MEDNKSIFNYVGQLFATYGIIVLIFLVFGLTVGNMASNQSSLFELGSTGFTISTLFQLFLLSLLITFFQVIFLTDKFIKNMKMIVRNICFFGSIVCIMVFFSVVFVWFPVNEINAWLGFLVSFIICTCISIYISNLKERQENLKMEEALHKFQNLDK